MAKISLNDKCTLIYAEETLGNMGFTETVQTEKTVFCGVKSITGKEFADANKIGIKPEIVIIVRKEVYNNAVAVKYKGVLYSIYRTYTVSNDKDYIELYLTIKEGVGYGGNI